MLSVWVPVYATEVPEGEIWRVLGRLAQSHGGTLEISGRVGVVKTGGASRQRARVTVGEASNGQVLVWIEPGRLGFGDSYLCAGIAHELGGTKPPRDSIRSRPS